MWRRKAPAAQGAHRAGAKILADAHPHIGRQIANGERLAAAGFCNSLLQRGEDRLRLSGDIKIGKVPSFTSPAVRSPVSVIAAV